MEQQDKISKKQEPLDQKVMNDELVPQEGVPMEQAGQREGEDIDTAGMHGDLAVEGAKTLDETAKGKNQSNL